MKVSRQEFVDSTFMNIELTSYEKKWVHSNKFHLEITLDRQNIKIKKKYSELKRFSEEIEKNLKIKDIALEASMRSNQQFKNIQELIRRLNKQFLEIPPQLGEKEKHFRKELRNYLYNMLFYNDQMTFSDDEEDNLGKKEEKKYTFSHQNLTIKNNASNEQKVDKSLKGKSMALAASLVSNVLKRAETQPMKEIFKNINLIWIKTDSQWQQCRLTISDTTIILYNLFKNIKQVIILCKMNVEVRQEPYYHIILSHRLLNQHIYLRLSNLKSPMELHQIGSQKKEKALSQGLLRMNSLGSSSQYLQIGQQTKLSKQEEQLQNNRYIALYSNLKVLCNKQKMIQTFNFVKIKIKIGCIGSGSQVSTISASTVGSSGIRDMVKQHVPTLSTDNKHSSNKKAKQLAIKLIHEEIISTFTVFPQSECQMLIPILSHFGTLQFFTSEVKQTGVIPNFKENVLNFSIPVQNIYDLLYNYIPKRKTQIRSINLESKTYSYHLDLSYVEMGSKETYYSFDTEFDKFQGNKEFDEPNKDQVRIQFNRLKRISWTVELYVEVLKDLQRFTNPLLSYIFYGWLVLAVIFTDLNYILHYILAVFILVMSYNHPRFSSYLKQIIHYTQKPSLYKKFSSLLRFRNPYASQQGPNYEIHFKFDIQKKLFLENFELTMKKKRNIYKKYKRLQEILVKGQNVLMETVNYLEKVKNIFLWYHYKKSYIVYTFLLAIFFLIVFIPLRLIFLFVIYKIFKHGKKYFHQTQTYNESVIKEIFMLTIRDNKLEDSIIQYMTNENKSINKKDWEYQTFEKKVKENLEHMVGIEVPNSVFEHAKTIKQLKYLLSLCKKRYHLPLMLCRKYEISDRYSYSSSTTSKIGQIIIGFITTIPSDRNILGVKTIGDEQEEKIEKVQQAISDALNPDEWDQMDE